MNDKAETLPVEAPEPGQVQIFNPLDAQPAAFAEQLAQRSENYDALKMHLFGQLVPGKDFGRIHHAKDCDHKWSCTFTSDPGHWSENQLLSPGADKVLGILGLSVTYPDDQDYRRACLQGMSLQDIITKAFIVDGHGQIICEGLGACSRDECKGNLNNTLKKAGKRARVDAVRRIPTISALFDSSFLDDLAAQEDAKTANTTEARQRQVHPRHATGAQLEVMPFGKHKGERFADLPDEYIDWILVNVRDKPDVLEAAKRENNRRIGKAYADNGGDPPAPDMPPAPPLEDFDDDIPF